VRGTSGADDGGARDVRTHEQPTRSTLLWRLQNQIEEEHPMSKTAKESADKIRYRVEKISRDFEDNRPKDGWFTTALRVCTSLHRYIPTLPVSTQNTATYNS